MVRLLSPTDLASALFQCKFADNGIYMGLLQTGIDMLLDVIYPPTCHVCGERIGNDEKYICFKCMADLPVTQLHKLPFNPVEQRFAGLLPIVRATSLFYYRKNTPYASILHDIKYRNCPKLAEWLTEMLSQTLVQSGFFDGIDYIIPIPLHWMKRLRRGYNQSEYIARGIHNLTGIPIDTSLVASRSHSTQTRKNAVERLENTKDIFSVRHAAHLRSKHILLVDDVLTTGATTISAGKELMAIDGVRISILTLSVADSR